MCKISSALSPNQSKDIPPHETSALCQGIFSRCLAQTVLLMRQAQGRAFEQTIGNMALDFLGEAKAPEMPLKAGSPEDAPASARQKRKKLLAM
jgi:hypothetical protein